MTEQDKVFKSKLLDFGWLSWDRVTVIHPNKMWKICLESQEGRHAAYIGTYRVDMVVRNLRLNPKVEWTKYLDCETARNLSKVALHNLMLDYEMEAITTTYNNYKKYAAMTEIVRLKTKD